MKSWPAILPAASGTSGTGTGSDYTKTFLAGLQLGRRIKIYDALRQTVPPVPPVPPGVFILAEDGTPIIAEKKDYVGATVYGLGTYPAIRYVDYMVDSEPYDSGMLTIKTYSGVLAPEIQLFYMSNQTGVLENMVDILWFCDADAYDPEAWGHYIQFIFDGDKYGRTGVNISLSPVSEDYGIKWAQWHPFYVRPDGAELFYGTDEEAAYWAAHSPNIPLITEGEVTNG